MGKKNALGRGLGALIDTSPQIETQGSSTMGEILISQIEANPYQPRKEFNEVTLMELSTSIKEVGVIQPVTVRQIAENRYQLISGERRLRASKMAGLAMIPAYIRIAEDNESEAMALIENIQREDLDAIQIALAYQAIIEKNNLTQEGLSEKVGKNRSTVANSLRLLKLPAEIQIGIRNGHIQMGHARALVGISEDPIRQLFIYHQIIKQGLSVRKVEELVKAKKNDEVNAHKPSAINSDYDEIRDQMSHVVGAPVSILRKDNGSGKITLSFQSDEELEHIIAFFDQKTK